MSELGPSGIRESERTIESLRAELAAVRQELATANNEWDRNKSWRKELWHKVEELEAALRETRQALRDARAHLRPEIGGRFDQKAAVAVIDAALAAAAEADDAKEQNRWWEDGYDPIPAAEGSAP